MIRFTNVTKAFGDGVVVVENCSFSIEKGEFVFLTGGGGAGKTTVLKLICMEELPTAGSVVACGYDAGKIRRRDLPLLRRKLGLVFPDFGFLSDRTVFENVAFALQVTGGGSRTVTRKSFETLSITGLSHKAGFRPGSLSGSEQWRLRIARALVNDPLVLLADDPLRNLDAGASTEIFDLLHSTNLRGTTVVMATHDTTFIQFLPNRRIIMDRGRAVDKV